ncbi:MAG: hypothetical protein ABIO70_22160 [Pseudomonadota bacterium]
MPPFHRPSWPRSLPVLAVLAAISSSCRPLPQAPTELSELSSWLFFSFESEDPDLLTAGLGNLRDVFLAAGVDSDFEDQAWALTSLTAADVADVEHPDRDVGAALPVGLVFASAFAAADQARVVVLPDQTPVEPSSPGLYDRTFLEPEQPACFPPARCDLLRTDNLVRKENAFMSITYTKRKDFRWCEVRTEDGVESGILARSWMPAEALGEAEATAIYQSYSLDVFLPGDDGGSLRYIAMWTEAEMYGLGGDVVVNIMRDGIEEVMLATEAWLEVN